MPHNLQQFISSILAHSGWDKIYTQKKWAYELESIDSEKWAQLLVETVNVQSAFEFIQQQIWIFDHHDKTVRQFQNKNSVLQQLLISLNLQQLASWIGEMSDDQLKQVNKLLSIVKQSLIDKIKNSISSKRQKMVGVLLQLIEKTFQDEVLLSHEKIDLANSVSNYRSFDFLDEIFELNYDGDQKKSVSPHAFERLYEGAGEGVQSSYSTLFSLLRSVNMTAGTRFIDLGSGYGRVGLIVGLLEPGVDFIGYEFESHRVDVANNSARLMGVEGHVDFITQDLAKEDFQIPEADIYYLYDPFCEKTYQNVLKQLIEISKNRRISIATKGNSKLWLHEIAVAEGWTIREEINGDNLCVYGS